MALYIHSNIVVTPLDLLKRYKAPIDWVWYLSVDIYHFKICQLHIKEVMISSSGLNSKKISNIIQYKRSKFKYYDKNVNLT